MCFPRGSGFQGRERAPHFQASTHLHPRVIQTHSRRRQYGRHTTYPHTVTELPSPTSQARIREEGGSPHHSQRARKKERSKADLRQSVLRTGEKTKLGEELGLPGRRCCRMEGGLFHTGPWESKRAGV